MIKELIYKYLNQNLIFPKQIIIFIFLIEFLRNKPRVP